MTTFPLLQQKSIPTAWCCVIICNKMFGMYTNGWHFAFIWPKQIPLHTCCVPYMSYSKPKTGLVTAFFQQWFFPLFPCFHKGQICGVCDNDCLVNILSQLWISNFLPCWLLLRLLIFVQPVWFSGWLSLGRFALLILFMRMHWQLEIVFNNLSLLRNFHNFIDDLCSFLFCFLVCMIVCVRWISVTNLWCLNRTDVIKLHTYSIHWLGELWV